MTVEGDSSADSGGSEDTSSSSTHGKVDDDPTPPGVKMGSTRTVVAMMEDGDVETIEDLTCLVSYDDTITGEEQVIIGNDAAVQYPERVSYMLRTGLPTDEKANDLPENSVVVYALPSIDNEAGQERFEVAIEDSRIGGRQNRSVPEALCGSVKALGDGLEAIDETFIGVNLGSTNLEVSAFRKGKQLVPFSTGAVTGVEVDRHIANNIVEETQGLVNVDLSTAREYKEEYTDFGDYESLSDTIQQPGGRTYEFTIEDSFMDAVHDYVHDVDDEFAKVIMPALDQDHMKVRQPTLRNPIELIAGMACIPSIESEFTDRVSIELGIDVSPTKPETPDTTAAIGTFRIAERLADLGAY